jgi:hypothetical protein
MAAMQTFLVRVWTPATGEAGGVPAGIRGLVEHVGSRSSRPFEGEHDLARFIEDCLQDHQEGICIDTGPAGPEAS